MRSAPHGLRRLVDATDLLPLSDPRWDRRLRIGLDWTIALFFRPSITRVDLRVERELVKQARHLV
jgi:hypothetical protein